MLLPLAGMQFKILMIFGTAAPTVGLLMCFGSAVLIFLGLKDNPAIAISSAATAAGIGIVVFIAIFVGGFGTGVDKVERLTRQNDAFCDLLQTVHDGKSANAVRPKVDAAVAELVKSFNEAKDLHTVDENQQYFKDMTQSFTRLGGEIRRLAAVPDAAATLMPAIRPYITAIASAANAERRTQLQNARA